MCYPFPKKNEAKTQLAARDHRYLLGGLIVLLSAFFVTIFFLYNPSAVHADFTPYQTPVACGSNGSDCTKVYVDDNVADSYAVGTSPTKSAYYQFSSFVVPTGSDITALEVKLKVKGSSSGWTQSLSYVFNNAAFSWPSIAAGYISGHGTSVGVGSCSPGSNGALGFCYYNPSTGYPSMSTATIKQWNRTDANKMTDVMVNSGVFKILVTTNTANFGQDTDYVAVRLQYETGASSAVDSAVASTSAGIVTVNLSGNTRLSGVHNKCEINLFYNKLSGSSSVPSGSLAKILLDTRYTPNVTQVLSGNTYQGFSYSTTDSVWQANGIVLPYLDGISADIRQSVKCVNDGGVTVLTEQGISEAYPNFSTDLIATPAAISNSHTVLQPECGQLDIVCAFQNWIYRLFNEIFGIQYLFNDPFLSLRTLANSKIPFAYVNAIGLMDLSATGASEAPPHITVDFPSGIPLIKMSGHMIDVDVSSNVAIVAIQTYARPIFVVLLWGSFIFGYLLHRGRSL